MRTSLAALIVSLIVAIGAGCNKPTADDCHAAVENMRRLLATDKNNIAGDVESAVRRCRGSSKKKSVECAKNAQTVDELKACGLLPEPAPEKPSDKK